MQAKERFGWILFTASGVLFMIAAIRVRDWLTIASGVSWLIGCAVFLSGVDNTSASTASEANNPS